MHFNSAATLFTLTLLGATYAFPVTQPQNATNPYLHRRKVFYSVVPVDGGSSSTSSLVKTETQTEIRTEVSTLQSTTTVPAGIPVTVTVTPSASSTSSSSSIFYTPSSSTPSSVIPTASSSTRVISIAPASFGLHSLKNSTYSSSGHGSFARRALNSNTFEHGRIPVHVPRSIDTVAPANFTSIGNEKRDSNGTVTFARRTVNDTSLRNDKRSLSSSTVSLSTLTTSTPLSAH